MRSPPWDLPHRKDPDGQRLINKLSKPMRRRKGEPMASCGFARKKSSIGATGITTSKTCAPNAGCQNTARKCLSAS
jgi:hypothetical protein